MIIIIVLIHLKPQNSNVKAEKVKLRSSYSNLSVVEAQAIQHFTIRKTKKWGFYGHSTIKHDSLLILKEMNDNKKLIIDPYHLIEWGISQDVTFGMNWEKAKHLVNAEQERIRRALTEIAYNKDDAVSLRIW